MSKNERFKRAIEEIKFEHKLKQSEIATKLEVTGTYLSDMINLNGLPAKINSPLSTYHITLQGSPLLHQIVTFI